MTRVSSFLIVIHFFFWFWIFGWLSQQLLFRDFRRARVSPFLSTTLSLDKDEDVMVGEVDELEEDVG